MIIRNLDWWSTSSFDASGTLADAIVSHAERLNGSPTGIATLLETMQKRWKMGRRRRDGRWTCFDCRDGSVVMFDFSQREVRDELGSVWPWLWAVPGRVAAEVLLSRGLVPGEGLPVALGFAEAA